MEQFAQELICPEDQLIADDVGIQSKDKHDVLRKYIEITATPRSQYTNGNGKATYIDLFCGSGKALIRNNNEWIDGSPILAFHTAKNIKSKNGKNAHFDYIYINDQNPDLVNACACRLKKSGFNTPKVFTLGAIEASEEIARIAPPYALNFAFIDPFSIEQLDFKIIQNLSKLKRIDMLIHFSVMDLNRNFKRLQDMQHRGFEAFAPGWRSRINIQKGKDEFIIDFLDYWKSLIQQLNAEANPEYHLVRGGNNQPLYALMLIAKHKLAHKLWEAIEIGPKTLFS